MVKREEIIPDEFREEIEKEMATVSPEDYKTWSVRRHNSLALFEKVFANYHNRHVRMRAEIEEAIVNYAIRSMRIRQLISGWCQSDSKLKEAVRLNVIQEEVKQKYGQYLHQVCQVGS